MLLVVNALLMIALPAGGLVLVRWITGARWSIAGWGALGFVASQVVHLPLLGAWQWLTTHGAIPGLGATADAILLGLLAAGCEEPARALVFRFALASRRDRSTALMAGAGHGGIEAFALGVLALLGAVNVIAIRGMSVGDLEAQGLDRDAAETAVAQVAQALEMPWYEMIGGAFERAVTIPFHIACSVLVMAAMRRGRAWPFVIAVAAHATTDASIGLLRELGQSGWTLELELAAMAVPFTIGVLVWATRAEPAATA